ncbi:PilN domain-containing protein [Methyloterricola oryzae]|uniref:PilN domain-containing protein n=1 Tax=Methyloterricola oryzae TaxID=1495050 RepID=UPI0005EBEFF0|nr:PilN domain-containing protein [Methyloterricola oryzae]
MARINLLPWRAELRKQQQKDFAAAIMLGLALTAAIFLLVRSHIGSQIEYQTQRNQFLQSEIAVLDGKIKEIQNLEAQKKKLLAKMEIIQQLQSSRPEIVHLFDEIARTVPEGVFLNDLTQSDKNLTINGFAQSNARVSAYMRSLEASPWLKDPVLTIIESKDPGKDSKKGKSRFTLLVKQGNEKLADKGQGKP